MAPHLRRSPRIFSACLASSEGDFERIDCSGTDRGFVGRFICSRVFSADKAYGAAVLFALAAAMLGLALVRFALEARLALREPDL